MKKIGKQQDLTNGHIIQVLTRLALPIMAASFLGTAYNITDMIWVGLLGSKAMAGIGVAGMYLWLSNGLVTLPRMGGQVNMAQSIGESNYDYAKKFAVSALKLASLFALLCAAICLVFTAPLLHFFRLEDAESIRSATVYLRITGAFLIFPFLNQTLTGLYTAQGDSSTPFAANLIGLVTNMILDPLMIFGVGFFPPLGVYGAAIATVTSQGIVLTVLVISILRSSKEENLLKTDTFLRPSPLYFYQRICIIGIPSSIQSCLYCVISMILTRIVSGYGSTAIAVLRVGGQIESISWNTADGFGSALNAFSGQNYGAGKIDRIQKSYLGALKLLTAWGTVISILFILFPAGISSIFFHEASEIPQAASYMRIIGLSQVFMIVELATIGVLSGLGRTALCSGISITLTGLRIPLALLLTQIGLGASGVWTSMSLSSISKGIILYLSCRHILKKLILQTNQDGT